MIKNLQLTNFQGHKASHLDFAPGVNVITGESDVGKSTIIRALWWLIANRPSGAGEKWAHWDMEKNDIVNVAVGLDNGAVARFRKGSKNGYEVDVGEGPVELVAIRSDVPKEVSDTLDLGEQNVQSQHQPYFLLADSPGDVARKLNAVCGVDIIDSCLKNANLLVTQNERDNTTALHRNAELANQLHELEYVDAFAKQVEKVEVYVKDLGEVEERIARLEGALASVDEADGVIAELKEFVQVESELQALLDTFAEWDELNKKVGRLESVLEGLEKMDGLIDLAFKEVLEAQNLFDNTIAELGMCPLCGQEMSHE